MHPLADTGRVIAGRYRLQAPIGRGAMGVVWRARDQLLDRDVAVKEVKIADTLTDQERANAYQRTLREAKTAARLNHPAVVTVYDVAEDEGRPWIVMQLVNAQSLDQVLASSGPLSPRRAAEMGRQLLSALSVAHSAGVMHRDVKPSNVLLGHDDRAVLTDFGIATFQGDPKLTQTGMVMGSPGFTAPERIRGEDASPASDLWSLGATLFAAVEGHGPFETARRSGHDHVRHHQRRRARGADGGRAGPGDRRAAAPRAGGPAGRGRGGPDDHRRAAAADRPACELARWLRPYRDIRVAVAEAAGAGPPPATGPAPGTGPALGTADRAGLRLSGQDDLAGPGQPGDHRPGGRPGDPRADGTHRAAAGPGRVFRVAGRVLPRAVRIRIVGSARGTAARFLVLVRPVAQVGPCGVAGLRAPVPARFRVPGAARYGPGPPSGPGYQSPPPQPGPGSAPARRQPSGLGWKIAIAVLALIGVGAGVATVLLMHHNDSAGPAAGASAPAPGSSPPQIVDAINQAPGPLPAGYATYSQPAARTEKAGFSLAAPSLWTKSANGFQTHLTDPSAANIYLLVDLTPHTHMNDMLREAAYIRNQSLSAFPGYHQLGLARLRIRGQPGAYWKFTWNDHGVQQEAIDLLYVAQTSAGPQSYAMFMTSPASIWSQPQVKSVFDEEMRTFTPAT